MTSAPGVPPVVDVPGQSRYLVEDHGMEAELVYDVEDGRLFILHTGVPEALSGHGIGGRLVRAAIDRAAREHLTVVPWCPFARRWLHQHPGETQGVSIDWNAQLPS